MHQLGLKFGYREFISYSPKDAEERALLLAANHID